MRTRTLLGACRCAGYKRSAKFKVRLAAVCRAHLTLGLLSLAWAVAVPWWAGKTTVPLPCATAATALFCALSGGSAAGPRTTGATLDKFAKLARSAVMLVRAQQANARSHESARNHHGCDTTRPCTTRTLLLTRLASAGRPGAHPAALLQSAGQPGAHATHGDAHTSRLLSRSLVFSAPALTGARGCRALPVAPLLHAAGGVPGADQAGGQRA
jgi:hypothetical protein